MKQSELCLKLSGLEQVVILTDEQDSDVRKVRFTFSGSQVTLWLLPMLKDGDDADRGRFYTRFAPNSAIDISFVNAFNNGSRGTYARYGEMGPVLVNSFILGGLQPKWAELVFLNHLHEFRRETKQFNDLAHARIEAAGNFEGKDISHGNRR